VVHQSIVIELGTERISPELEQKLRQWLAKPECDTLRQVVATRCQLLQASALNKALVSKPGDTSDLISQDDMRQATRYANFRVILDEIATQPKNEPFLTAKLLPLKAHATIQHDPES
jgi:hypothetical protein